jgi:FkbM family methyltransferase
MLIPEKMRSHINKIFNGEYNVPFYPNDPLVIVDIGANVGGFIRWAASRWAGSTFYAFEPIKNNFEILEKNILDIPNVNLYNVAVGSSDRTQKMFYGKSNEGEASLFFGNEQVESGEDVNVISATQIPNCHILKIDTEGSEIEIIENLIIDPAVYLIEYHSEINRLKIDELLKNKYSLVGSKSERFNYGIVKYAKNALVK